MKQPMHVPGIMRAWCIRRGGVTAWIDNAKDAVTILREDRLAGITVERLRAMNPEESFEHEGWTVIQLYVDPAWFAGLREWDGWEVPVRV